MNLIIEGLACLGSFGNGPEALVAGLHEPLRSVDANGSAAPADTSGLKAFLPARATRQMDHFTRMALLCALRALDDAQWLEKPENGVFVNSRDIGIVLATGFGPASPTFEFLDSFISYGENMASPLAFSHSVHNIPASSIAMKLGITGPCATFCQWESSVTVGLLTARQWLAEKRVKHVLFGAVDELTPLLVGIRNRLATCRKERITPRKSSRAPLPVSEGAAFFCLSADHGPASEKAGPGIISRLALYRGDIFNPCAYPQPLILVSGQASHLPAAPFFFQAGHAYGKIPIGQAFDAILALGGKGMPFEETGAPEPGETLCLSTDKHGLFAELCVRPSRNLYQEESQ